MIKEQSLQGSRTQKISGCFRTLAGADAFARVRSYIQTAAKQDQNLFEVLLQLVTGTPWKPEWE